MGDPRDIVVIGASAGGIDAVATLLAQLPVDLNAAVCVTIHVPASAEGEHIRLLGRAASLPVRRAEDGGALYRGNIYVAPPDHHLVLGPGNLRVARGPKENRTRPAIDPLFRSAADIYGRRVVGVLLTGYLDDGVAGLAAIQRAGGMTIVQDPADAHTPDMPAAALSRIHVDHTLPLHRMGAVIVGAVGGHRSQPAGGGAGRAGAGAADEGTGEVAGEAAGDVAGRVVGRAGPDAARAGAGDAAAGIGGGGRVGENGGVGGGGVGVGVGVVGGGGGGGGVGGLGGAPGDDRVDASHGYSTTCAGIEARIAGGEDVGLKEQEDLGEQAGLGCPECGGPLVRVRDPDIKRFRCHIGHAYTERALLDDQADRVERALAAALRTLEERARLLSDLARQQGSDTGEARALYARADEARDHAETLRQIVLRGAGRQTAA